MRSERGRRSRGRRMFVFLGVLAVERLARNLWDFWPHLLCSYSKRRGAKVLKSFESKVRGRLSLADNWCPSVTLVVGNSFLPTLAWWWNLGVVGLIDGDVTQS